MMKKPAIHPSKQFLTIFLWSLLFLMYLEILTRILSTSPEIKLFSSGLITSVLFSISITFLALCLIYLFHERYHYIYAIAWMIVLFILFSSQIIYQDIFRTFYFVQSITHVDQGLSFRSVVISAIFRNLWWMILSLLIIGIYLYIEIRKRKKHLRNRYSWKTKTLFISSFFVLFIVSHFLSILFVNSDERKHEMYFHAYAKNYAVEKLGLFTTFRLDLQRNGTRWTPIIDVATKEPEHNEKEEPPTYENENKEDKKEEKIEQNKLDIPFDELIEKSSVEEITQLHRYFQQKEPSNKNEFTGKFKDYNLIWITAEGYAPYAVHEELTPTLHKLSKESYQFPNFYNPLWAVSTSDGEYTILHSLVPKANDWSFSRSGENDVPFSIGNQLKEKGYETKAYHNHTYDYYDRDISHPNMGYDYKASGNGLNITRMWPRSDLETTEETVAEYIDKDPFHVYYMTVSGHLEYNFIGNQIAQKNRKFVDHLDMSEESQAYIAGQIELDRALEALLNQLEEKDILDETLIVMTGDHYPYGLENDTIEELTGEPVDEKFDIYKNEWILYAPEMENEDVVIEEPTYTLDMLPTISNLMGLDFDSRLFMGRDVFSKEEPFVVFEDKSFITKDIKYYYPNDEVIPINDQDISEDELKAMQQKTDEIFYYSTLILDYDYYSTITWNKEDGKDEVNE